MLLKTGVPWQAASLGAYRLKVTVPVGLEPPVTEAVSWIAVPTGPPPDGVVGMLGLAWVLHAVADAG